MTTINFYKQYHKYGEFSNFYEAPIVIDNVEFPTNEHYFQAMKFSHSKEHFDKVRNAKNAYEAFKLGRCKLFPIRDDWNNVKDDIMYKALEAKFNQHAKLKKMLLDTKDAILVEHTINDSYWGDAGDGSGKNILGVLLMKLRKKLSVK